MKLKRFNQIKEDAAATSAVAGMGSVVTSSPSAIPGSTMAADCTVGSGDIGVPFGIYQQVPAYGSKKKKGKKEKKPKKYKFSDMIKFEDFDQTKHVLENFNMQSIDAAEFEEKMDKVVKSLNKASKEKAKHWKDAQQRDLFDKLNVKNWKDAFEKDPSACIAYKSRLDDYFNIPSKKIKESVETLEEISIEDAKDELFDKYKNDDNFIGIGVASYDIYKKVIKDGQIEDLDHKHGDYIEMNVHDITIGAYPTEYKGYAVEVIEGEEVEIF